MARLIPIFSGRWTVVSFLRLMKDLSPNSFGLLIAYLVPGITVLVGASPFSPTVRSWLAATPADAPSLGGFLYVTLASVAAGVTVNTVRWAVLDTIHRWTGLPQPAWDFGRLQDHVAAYNVLNEIHYKYYQFHANLLVALCFFYLARRIHLGFTTAPLGWFDLGTLVLAVILFVGSRDTLRKYYAQVSHFLAATGAPKGARPVGRRSVLRRPA